MVHGMSVGLIPYQPSSLQVSTRPGLFMQCALVLLGRGINLFRTVWLSLLCKSMEHGVTVHCWCYSDCPTLCSKATAQGCIRTELL